MKETYSLVPCGLEDPNYRADDVDPYEPVIEVGPAISQGFC